MTPPSHFSPSLPLHFARSLTRSVSRLCFFFLDLSGVRRAGEGEEPQSYRVISSCSVPGYRGLETNSNVVSDSYLGMTEIPSPRRFSVGYALAPKKQKSFIQPSLVGLAHGRGIDLVPIDTSRRLADQGPFDCVLHKLYGDDWKAQLVDFAAKNPGVPIVDPPLAIERLHNRISMLQVVSELKIPQDKDTFGIPSQVVIYDSGTLSNSGVVGALRFPVIAKPLVADGSAKSHKMSLIFHREGLLKLKPPLVLQEFVNHGGVIFKVYVVGDYVQCVKRKSLPDVSEEKLESAEGSITFSQVSNMTTQDPAEVEYYMHHDEAEMPPLSFLSEIASGLRRALGLHLFNFDVIRDVKVGNHYLVIDINYFPGYAKMPSYETTLTDFFWNIVHEKTEQNTEDLTVASKEN